MLVMSENLKKAIDEAPKRKYEIARDADLDHTVLSKLMHDVLRLRMGDPRVLKLGRMYGFQEATECFQELEVDHD